MNSLRFARAALRARPAAIRAPLQRRTYADAVPDKASSKPSSRSTCLGSYQRLSMLTPSSDQAELVAPSPGTPFLTRLILVSANEAIGHELKKSDCSGNRTKLISAISFRSLSTSPRTSSRSTSRPRLARWVSSPTTFLPLSS